MIERRKRQRFVEKNDVIIRNSLNKYKGTGIEAFTYDISTGGARIVSRVPFAVGSSVRVRIDLAGSGDSVTLEGEIKWLKADELHNRYEFGIEFMHLTSHTVLSLIRHLYGRHEGVPSTLA